MGLTDIVNQGIIRTYNMPDPCEKELTKGESIEFAAKYFLLPGAAYNHTNKHYQTMIAEKSHDGSDAGLWLDMMLFPVAIEALKYVGYAEAFRQLLIGL